MAQPWQQKQCHSQSSVSPPAAPASKLAAIHFTRLSELVENLFLSTWPAAALRTSCASLQPLRTQTAQAGDETQGVICNLNYLKSTLVRPAEDFEVACELDPDAIQACSPHCLFPRRDDDSAIAASCICHRPAGNSAAEYFFRLASFARTTTDVTIETDVVIYISIRCSSAVWLCCPLL